MISNRSTFSVPSPRFTGTSAEEQLAIEAAKIALQANPTAYSEDIYMKVVNPALKQHNASEKKRELVRDMRSRTSQSNLKSKSHRST